MPSKWTVYFLTLLSFAFVHSIRSTWSSLKSILHEEPFNMSAEYLGVLDMATLFSLAITVGVFGSQVQKYRSKKVLNAGMTIVAGLSLIIGICLLLKITFKFLYFILYGIIVGIVSASSWPACLSILSKRFNKKNNIALPLWNGTSQLGDFIALFISDLIIQGLKINGCLTLVIISFLMITVVLLNKAYLPQDTFQSNHWHLNQQKQNDLKKIQIQNSAVQQWQQPERLQLQMTNKSDSDKQITSKSISQQEIVESNQSVTESEKHIKTSLKSTNFQQTSKLLQPVNFMNVWLLPSVAGYVISTAMVKSVNSMLVAWLVYYLYQLQMKSEARIIAILWSIFVFIGGALGGYFNPHYSKKIFIFSLVVSAVMFLFLEGLHLVNMSQFGIIISVIICALFYGGPYNLMSTAIPIVLSQKPEIKDRPNAKSAIIALMDGFSKLINGFILIIVPQFGVLKINWIGFFLCTSAALILGIEQYKQSHHKYKPKNKGSSSFEQKGIAIK